MLVPPSSSSSGIVTRIWQVCLILTFCRTKEDLNTMCLNRSPPNGRHSSTLTFRRIALLRKTPWLHRYRSPLPTPFPHFIQSHLNGAPYLRVKILRRKLKTIYTTTDHSSRSTSCLSRMLHLSLSIGHTLFGTPWAEPSCSTLGHSL